MSFAPATSQFTIPGSDGLALVAYRWDPDGDPRGIVQVTHGMGDHAQRFGNLAAALAKAGFQVIGVDQRGNGATAAPGALGQIGGAGWSALVADVGAVSRWAREAFPGLPLTLFGHSMGSFAVQQHMLDHPGDVDALILSGTAVLDLLEPALNLEEPIDLAMFNAPFAPARTDFDWLSRDEAIVDAYVQDPWCGAGLDVEAGQAMFAGARRLADPASLAVLPDALPVLVVVGEADPVNGAMQLVHALLQRLADAGLTDVTLQSYPDGRHEVLNETNRDEVIAAVAQWVAERGGA